MKTISQTMEIEILEFFVDQGCAAVTATQIANEICEDKQDVLFGLYKLHAAGKMWTYGKMEWKPVYSPASMLAEVVN